jgi:hypothetical protein
MSRVGLSILLQSPSKATYLHLAKANMESLE